MATTYSPEAVFDLGVTPIFKELMETSTGVNSIYLKAKETLLAHFEESSLTARERAEVISNLLTNMTVQLTNTAMQSAINIAKENRDAPYVLTKFREDTKAVTASVAKIEAEVTHIAKQNEFIDAQITKLGADERLTEKEILKRVEDTLMVEAQTDKIKAEELNVEENTKVLTKQIDKTKAETALVENNSKLVTIQGWKIQGDLKWDYGMSLSTLNINTPVLSSMTFTGDSVKDTTIKSTRANVYNTYASSYRSNGVVTPAVSSTTGYMTSATADLDGLAYWQTRV